MTASLCADKARQRVFGLPLPRQRRLGPGQLLLQRLELFEDRLEVVDIVVEHETDGALHLARLVLERDAADDELAVVEAHDVEQDRPARLDHPAHQRMGDHVLDRQADRIEIGSELQQFAVALIDPGDARLRIDDDGALEIVAQQAEGAYRLLDGRVAMVGARGRGM